MSKKRRINLMRSANKNNLGALVKNVGVQMLGQFYEILRLTAAFQQKLNNRDLVVLVRVRESDLKSEYK
jgi:hypothetical protein